MKYLFFLIVFLLPIGLAYGEVGNNFDRELLGEINGNQTFRWTSHYDRIFNGNEWVNYILTDDINQIKFESAGISFFYDKNNCEFNLYEPNTNNIAVTSYRFNIAVDNNPLPLFDCNITDFVTTEDTISFNVDNGEFKTLFDLEPNKGLEWTHEIENKSGLIKITEVCDKCIVEELIEIGNKTLIDFGI